MILKYQLDIDVANDDMVPYKKTHYPLYSNNIVVINKKILKKSYKN